MVPHDKVAAMRRLAAHSRLQGIAEGVFTEHTDRDRAVRPFKSVTRPLGELRQPPEKNRLQLKLLGDLGGSGRGKSDRAGEHQKRYDERAEKSPVYPPLTKRV